MSTENLLQTSLNGQTAPDPTNASAWLQAKVEQYQAEVTRLEAELKHAQILLKGHKIWLSEIRKKAGQE